jgi:hypothetical protein
MVVEHLQTTEDGLDQSRLGMSLMGLTAADLKFEKSDRDVLRQLAIQLAEIAARPIEDEKRGLWYKHNGLEPTRPIIFCDPENGWTEIIPPSSLQCQHNLARQWEMTLRKEIFWGTEMGDDYVVEPIFTVPHVHADIDWGLTETSIGGELGGTTAIRWDAPVKAYEDLEKLRFPIIEVDHEMTGYLVDLAEAIFRDLLEVRVQTMWWWTLGMTMTLVFLRGLEQVLYDFILEPDLFHRLMSFLRDGTLHMLDELERQNLLSLNNDGTYVGSGGLGYSHELPQSDFEGLVRTMDMWGFGDSQETTTISPEMFAEFIAPYQMPILKRFGLNCYGCCEPLDKRWDSVSQIPRLRRVSCSPWADWADMAEKLGGKYIFSMKPSPTDLAVDHFHEDKIREGLREALRTTRDCRVEVIMKDNHTIRNDPQRVIRWCQIAQEEARNL